ncbi:hypothetical protein PF004_g27109 [Phytophthora fragariae]|uniref:Uncharacterized protein n=1 Tax=Phytophthora fragariae TaxID=53985 RepID=A0A6G0MLH1_9STRA|nr:hypothetical protein PF004_g27109 [Phytophthora fragariae]
MRWHPCASARAFLLVAKSASTPGAFRMTHATRCLEVGAPGWGLALDWIVYGTDMVYDQDC